uniref:Uncharacterized protein n=1 Tax=Eutreptiella gymnastica TaxID=73025 RepID=A0A7S4FW37_9EUGL
MGRCLRGPSPRAPVDSTWPLGCKHPLHLSPPASFFHPSSDGAPHKLCKSAHACPSASQYCPVPVVLSQESASLQAATQSLLNVLFKGAPRLGHAQHSHTALAAVLDTARK